MAAASVIIVCIDIILCITFFALIELIISLTAYLSIIRRIILVLDSRIRIKPMNNLNVTAHKIIKIHVDDVNQTLM